MAKNGVKFIGGRRILPGAPPRDLSHDEVEKFGGYDLLLMSGLYTAVKTPQKSTKKKESEVDNGNDNNGR